MDRTRLLQLIESRFDQYSAQVVFRQTLQRAGLPDQASYADGEVAAFALALETRGDRTQKLAERLRAMVGNAEATTPAPSTQTEVPAPEAPASAAPAEAAEGRGDRKRRKSASASAAPAPPPEPAAPTWVAVTFTVSGAPVEKGEVVCICGDLEALGAWDVGQAPACEATDEGTWAVTLALPPGQEASFKFLCRGGDEDNARWEQATDHVLVTPTSGETAFEAAWRA